jgi:DNA-binding response OmpR family regulator
MARVVFSGLEPWAAGRLANLLAADGHEIQQEKDQGPIRVLLNANIVFAGGEPGQYLSLLRRLRAVDPTLSFVVVTRLPDTSEWLDALDAGATDYWVTPFDQRQIRSLINAAVSRGTDSAEAANGSA